MLKENQIVDIKVRKKYTTHSLRMALWQLQNNSYIFIVY